MCGRVIAVLLIILSLSLDAFPQCSWAPRHSAQFRNTALDVAADDSGFLWVATGYGVSLYDIRGAGGAPIAVTSIALPGTTRTVLPVAGGIAYAGSGTRLWVLRRDGESLATVRSFDLGATVNDLAAREVLFVATANGIAHYTLFDPSNPIRTGVVLPTSGANVTSLAIHGNDLFAADGDATVEIFNFAVPSLPQHTGDLTSLTRSSAVHADGTGFVFVSDTFGQSTDVFSGSTRLARLALGATSFARGAGAARFMAGPDRTLRGADLSNTSRVTTLFEQTLGAVEGTDNAIHAMALSDETLYVAAGDIGLVTLDTSSLEKPYPLVGYLSGATSTTVAAGDRAWFADSGGKVTEYSIDTTGLSLEFERTWSGGNTLHDVADGQLLASSGSTVTGWTLAPALPTASFTATFPASVLSAVLRGTGAVALLSDRSLWTANPTPTAVTGLHADHLVRSGNALLLAEATDAGTTLLRYYASGDLSSTPVEVTVPGIAVGGVALSGTRATVFTFTGINVIDLTTSTVSVVSGSNTVIPARLELAGEALLALADDEIRVYENGALARTIALPSDGAALDTSGTVAVVATSDGPLAASWTRDMPDPARHTASAVYTGIAHDGTRLALSGKQRIDLFATASGLAPHFIATVDPAGVLERTGVEIDHELFTLSASGTVTVLSRAGAALRSVRFDRGADARALGIRSAGGALWVSFEKGCQSGACVQETLVVDPATLSQTSTMNGGVVDATWSGTKAWALFAQPSEMRVLNLADPRHPAVIVSAAAPPTATSIAYRAGRVFLLAEQLFAFHESTLGASDIYLAAVQPAGSQKLRILGDCAVVTGRSAGVEWYDARTWDVVPSPWEAPSTLRTFVVSPDRIHFLTDHSLEVWTMTDPPPDRRRAVR